MNQTNRTVRIPARGWLLAVAIGILLPLCAQATPIVIERSPARGESLAQDDPVWIRFSEPMDNASVEAAWQITPEIAGALDWTDEATVRFTPSVPWPSGTRYGVTISTAARSARGEPITDEVTFHVDTLVALEMAQVSPASGAQGVSVTTNIVLMFGQPIVPLQSLADPAREQLPHPLQLTPEAPGTGTWINTSVYVFTPSEPLRGGMIYIATVPAGLRSTLGAQLSEPIVWSFSTERPQIISTTPTAGQQGVSIRPAIRITFNMPVCTASVASRFSLKRTGLLGEWLSLPITGTWTSQGNAVVFTPDSSLAFDQSYLFSLDAGVTGTSGGLGTEASLRVRFATVPLPKLLRTSPQDGATGVYPYTSLVLTFNAPIDPDTVLENVTIVPEPEPGHLSGYYRSWDLSYVVWFDCQPSQTYEIRIGPDIADPHGNRIGHVTTVRFGTRALEPTAWLLAPDQIGTLNTYQTPSLFVAHRNVESISLSLYRIPLQEVFRAINDWSRYSPPDDVLVRTWTQSVSGDKNRVAYTQTLLVDGDQPLEPGVYLIDLKTPGLTWNRWQNRHLLVASPINLTLKTTTHETLVWACDLWSGAPVAGLVLRAYDAYGEPVEVSITDRDGLATFSGSDAYDWRGITVAATSPFTLGMSHWTRGISVWDFGFSSSSGTDQRLFLDTDRPIYRPGHTVFFRGVLRDEQDAAYSLPGVGSVEVTVRDAAWNEILRDTIPVDDFGTFSGRVDLSEDAPVGTYRIEVMFAGTRRTSRFVVAAYRAPEFEVVVRPHMAETTHGADLHADVDVTYYFGAPVVDQSVDWSAYVEAYRFTVPHLGRYTFTDRDDPWICWTCWWLPTPSPVQWIGGTVVTDSAGRARVEISSQELPSALAEEGGGSRTVTVEATTRGADGQVISGRGRVIVHAAEIYAGLSLPGAIARAGRSVDAEAVTVDWSGHPVPHQPLEFQIVHRTWHNTFQPDQAGGGIWVWEVEDNVVESGKVTTDALGRGTFSFVPATGGVHKVLLIGWDAEGRETRSSEFLWVTGPETVSWRRTQDDTISLIPDQPSYQVGETARILVPSPYDTPHAALVTVERGGILSRQVLYLESNSPVLEIPITEDHIPNIYISVVLLQGLEAAHQAAAHPHPVAESKVGYASLTVSRAPKQLKISIEPSGSTPRPGTEITYDLRVHDIDGHPVRAAIAFDLVDAAVLALRPRTPDAMLDAFYGPRGLGVSTSSGLAVSLNRLVAEQHEDTPVGTPSAVQEEETSGMEPPTAIGLGDEVGGVDTLALRSAPEKLPEGVVLREEFLDTAFWDAAVVTDESGHAQVTLRLPDNLTTWVARAVGISVETQIGEISANLLVTQPLLVRPVAPRFLVAGDRVRFLANVSNQTQQDLETDVELIQTGLSLESPSTQHVLVPAQGEVAVVWWGVVQDVEQVDLVVSAVSGDLSDAARPRLTTGPGGTLHVLQHTAPDTVGTAGQLDAAGARTELVVLPEGIDLARSTLWIQLETTLAAAMQHGLRYLEHFEYECTEQVISRFLPNVLTHRAVTSLGLERPEWEERLPHLVLQGVEKLTARQNSDGGWGWWDASESNPHLSAYAVLGLLHAERAGFFVPKDVMDRGIAFLSRSLVPTDRVASFRTADLQAWLLYVLAEAGPTDVVKAAAEQLFVHRAQLSHYARAWLALALHLTQADSGAVDAIVSDLLTAAILSATGAHWEETQRDRWAMTTDTRSTAVILAALIRLNPNQPLLPNVVRWLMVARRAGIWETTQETAWALIALTDWMVATQETSASYAFDLSVNGRPILDGQADGPSETPIESRLTADELLLREPNRITLSRSDGPGRLYYTAHLTSYVTAETLTALQRGVIVQRQYLPVGCAEDEVCAQIDQARAGEEILVRLTIIAPSDLYYVVLEDPFPAGCEPVDPSLATTSLAATSPQFRRDQGSSFWWWWRWYTRSEFRDEKVVLFVDRLPAGTYSFEYTLRAVHEGRFGVLPAVAHEFYFPEVFGRSEGRRLEILPADTP